MDGGLNNPFTPVKGVKTSNPRPITSHSPPFNTYNSDPSLPFPLNLPPSYSTRLHRPPGASVTPNHQSRVKTASKTKRTPTLDAFMHSRQAPDEEQSSSDSDTSLRQIIFVSQDSTSASKSNAPMSSSPASSSPLRTPRETSLDAPQHSSSRPSMYSAVYPSSPTPQPKHPKSSTILDTSYPPPPLPYTLPPGPYCSERPCWSLAALIGQAINASHSGALPLNDIYSYISTVYPHFDRRDQAWMSSVRHSLSVNEAFERVADQEGTAAQRVKSRGKTRLKGGFWRIRPGYEDCFLGGNYVRKGARGSGPGMNPASTTKKTTGKKRAREEDQEESNSEKKKAPSEERLVANANENSVSKTHYRWTSQTPVASSSPAMMSTQTRSYSSTPPAPTNCSLGLASPPPSSSSDSPSHPSIISASPAPRVVSPEILLNGRSSPRFSNTPSQLEAGFELEIRTSPHRLASSPEPDPNTDVGRELFTRVLASSSASVSSSKSIFPPSGSYLSSRSSLLPSFPSASKPQLPSPNATTSPLRPVTPPPCTPISNRGLQMSPSRSLAHYKASFEPEWKVAARRSITPPLPIHVQGLLSSPNQPATSPKCSILPPSSSPFRTPLPKVAQGSSSRAYDPYDPEMLLADEIERMRRAGEAFESPGGFFGKEGRKLLYESPSIPGKSDWRFPKEGL